MLKTYTLDDFKGLNLNQNDENLGFQYAKEAEEIEFPQRGGFQVRGGFQKFSDTPLGVRMLYLLQRDTFGTVMAVGMGEIATYSASSGVKHAPTGSPTWTADAVTPPAALGTGVNRYVFVASRNAGAGLQLRRYEDPPSGDSVGNATTACKPQWVAVFPGQNRLAQAGYFAAADAPGGANGSASTIFFSDEGAPDTYTATNFELLDPNNGERFVGMVGFQKQLFVFKNSTMYVFYGISPDDDGEPIFDYNSFALPDPIPVTSEPMNHTPVSVGPDGVYFIGSQGLWKTTGSLPTRVRTSVDPVFKSSVSFDAGAGIYSIVGANVTRTGWMGNKFYLNYTTAVGTGFGGVQDALVWDRDQDVWYKQRPLGGHETTPIISSSNGWVLSGVTSLASAVGALYRQRDLHFTDEGGVIIPWKYRSGDFDFGLGGAEIRLRFVDVWGQNLQKMRTVAHGNRSGTGLFPTVGQTASPGTNVDRYRYNMPSKGRMFDWQTWYDSAQTPTVTASVERIEFRYSEGGSQ